MKWYSLCAFFLLNSTLLIGALPPTRTGMMSNVKTESKKSCATQPLYKKIQGTKKTKKDCGLCTIEKGKWAITPKFAIAPTWYANRGNTLFIGQVAPTGLNSEETLGKFDDMFDLPLMYGGHVGYMFRKRVEFFLDLDYTLANGRTTHSNFDDTQIRQKFDDYRAFGAYLGTRIYAAFYRERLTPFIGLKLGYLYRWSVKTHETIDIPSGEFEHHPTFFKADSTIAGSLGLGFDVYFTDWVGFSFETECLISGQRRSATIFNPSPQPIIRVGDTGVLISMPFSFALKFKI